MRIYEIRTFEKRSILDKNFKWSHRWYLDGVYRYRRKADMLEALRKAMCYDRDVNLRNRFKYTIKCIEKGGAKRV